MLNAHLFWTPFFVKTLLYAWYSFYIRPFLACVDLYICLLIFCACMQEDFRMNPSSLFDSPIFSHDKEFVLFEDGIKKLVHLNFNKCEALGLIMLAVSCNKLVHLGL